MISGKVGGGQTLSGKEERSTSRPVEGHRKPWPSGGAEQVHRREARWRAVVPEHGPRKPGCSFAPLLWQTGRKDQ